jgi:hypothetical protein
MKGGKGGQGRKGAKTRVIENDKHGDSGRKGAPKRDWGAVPKESDDAPKKRAEKR